MTETVNKVDTERMGRPGKDADQPRLVNDALADRLIGQAREQGVSCSVRAACSSR